MAETSACTVALRPPEQVMRLDRLGSMHQCRLSFMRTLMRRMAGESWQFSCREFAINDNGVGHALYVAATPERSYTLVAFAHDLPAHMRSDRVIATAWDATFTLFDGLPRDADIERLAANVPLQEAGRVSGSELSLSRANRSVRLWEHVVAALAEGRQPDRAMIDDVGYLMRTTAVYGSGKFGAADYDRISGRPEMGSPFQAEMLSVYLTRMFVRDLVHHMARARGGDRATRLAPDIARSLGIGNSTGLGLGPYIINHPRLFNNWIAARETAIARVRALPAADAGAQAEFGTLVGRATRSVALWQTVHPVQVQKLAGLRDDLAALTAHLDTGALSRPCPWDALIGWSAGALGLEGQELVASLILEPHGALVDDLAATMSDHDSASFCIDGAMSVAAARDLVDQVFGWTRDIDWSARENCARAWYVSAEKLEPRLGERFEEPIEPYEQPLAPSRDAALALADLDAFDPGRRVAEFLLRHPEHRAVLRRAQMAAAAPYAEIRDNTIAADMFPVDLLRVKLAFFGATHFDPRSDRWLRISMFRGAPYPDELTPANADDWVYPQVAP